jgi:RNA polymerase sigma factor (sigma-70 family)
VATRMFDRRPAVGLADPHERVATIVARHGDLLLRVARQFSLCADDAHDAVQRALEIYMRRVDSLDPATEVAWLKVVVKHESLAVRRGRAGVAGEDVDLDAVPAVAQRSVEERFESNERVERSAEVMRRLKRDEARALMLKAEGLSYNEIGERLGWTYTKVNRCITEGRRRFMRLYEELETGVECERLAPTLHALAHGTASSEALLELRPHLRNCAGCRATVRALHASRLDRFTAFAPIAALVEPARVWIERLRGPRVEQPVELHPMKHSQDVDELFRQLNSGEPVVQSAAPAVAESAGRLSTVRVNLRGWLEPALQRFQSSDLAMGVHAATTGGGGRITSIAALIGICVSGVGAGTYCVATALLPDPKPAIRSEAKTAKRKATEKKLVRSPAAANRTGVRKTIVAEHSRRMQVEATDRGTSTRPTRASAQARPAGVGDEFSFERARARTAVSTSPSAPPTNGPASNDGFESGGASATTPPGSGEFDDGAGGEFAP